MFCLCKLVIIIKHFHHPIHSGVCDDNQPEYEYGRVEKLLVGRQEGGCMYVGGR